MIVPPRQLPALLRAVELHVAASEDGCLEWRGRMQNGVPAVFFIPPGTRPMRELSERQRRRRKAARKYLMVRRVMFEAFYGVELTDRQRMVSVCDNPRCVDPVCLRPMTFSQIGKLAAQAGKFSTIERRLKIAAAVRRRAKLDLEKARAIREAPTAAEGARMFGIHKSLAARIRRGEAWVDPARTASVFRLGGAA